MDCFDGLQVAIVGDIRHSRVARSQVAAYSALGAEVTLVAPATPAAAVGGRLGDLGDEPRLRRRTGQGGCGIAAPGPGRAGVRGFVPSLREYTAGYGLTKRRAALLRPEAIVLHPGPMVRGVEIASEVADLASAHMTRQVSNGVAIRMAVLFLLLGQGSIGGIHGGLAHDEYEGTDHGQVVGGEPDHGQVVAGEDHGQVVGGGARPRAGGRRSQPGRVPEMHPTEMAHEETDG